MKADFIYESEFKNGLDAEAGAAFRS